MAQRPGPPIGSFLDSLASPLQDRLAPAAASSLGQRLGWMGIPLLIGGGLLFSLTLIEEPIYGIVLVVAAGGLFTFFRSFEQTVLGILLLRSALDLYSGQQVPAAFALGVDLLALIYLGRALITRQPIITDRLWWMLAGWVALQGFWVALLPTGALGGTAFMAYEALREWVRFFSLGMVYLLVMQLRDRIPPERLVSLLFWCLAFPLFLAALQIAHVDLPGFLQSNVGWKDFEGTGDRINSTLGHYNSFATFSLLFIALALWRLQTSRRPLGWMLLIGGLLYCLIATKSLTGLVMLVVYGVLYFLPKLRGKGLFGAIALAVALAILLSTEMGQERLGELNSTPLLNPHLSISRAMALQAADMTEFRNSFNWRLLQWRDLLIDWQRYPLLGYGLATTKKLSIFNTTSHNDYIRFLVEEGVIGFSLFLLFLLAQMGRTLSVLRQAPPGSPQRALAAAMFPFSVALMVGMAAGNVMVHTATFFYWWVILAVLGWRWPLPSSASGTGGTAFSSFSSLGDRSPARDAVGLRWRSFPRNLGSDPGDRDALSDDDDQLQTAGGRKNGSNGNGFSDSSAYLETLYFEAVNFEAVNFGEVNFEEVNFEEVNFEAVNFEEVNFEEVKPYEYGLSAEEPAGGEPSQQPDGSERGWAENSWANELGNEWDRSDWYEPEA